MIFLTFNTFLIQLLALIKNLLKQLEKTHTC